MLLRVFFDKASIKASLDSFGRGPNEVFVRIYDNVAVVVIPAKIQIGNDQERNYLGTLVAVNKKGVWQLVSSHFSESRSQESSK